LRVAVSCFHFFGVYSREFIKLGLIANLFLGPLVLFLMGKLIKPNKKIISTIIGHFGLWVLLLVPTWFLFDFPTWNWKIRFVLHFFLTLYLIGAAWMFRKEIGHLFLGKNLSFHTRKAIIIYLSVVLICSGFAVSLFTNYIIGPLNFSVLFYLVGGYFLLNAQKVKKSSPPKKINQAVLDKFSHQLSQLMESEALYKNPDLKLESLANQLSISRHLLSQILNEELHKNFHQFINDYRIEEACRILKENRHYSIEAIGQEVGFHSRSSFFAAFKKKMGMTPSKFRAQG
ncbi:MAG: helix-turn-helix domain-containing protein, partial [Bacteroidota bacterium]